jgi:hypothetical protein
MELEKIMRSQMGISPDQLFWPLQVEDTANGHEGLFVLGDKSQR